MEPLLCFQKEGAAADLAIARAPAATDEAGAAPWLRCAACRAAVTRASERVTVGGAHAHERTNAGGWTYRFGCFASAPGCASVGVPSKQDTWFTGWFWHVQECAACHEHLGWLFFRDPGGASFYGLILDRLVEEPVDRAAPPS